MKKIVTIFAMQVLLVSTVRSQTADEIINRQIAARGGLEKMKNLQSVIMTGTMNQAGNDIAMKFYLVHNKASNMEYSLMGKTGYTIITTREGWTFNPFDGATTPTPFAAEQVKESQTQLDQQRAMVDSKSKGNKVALAGKETIERVPCFKRVPTRPDGKTATYFIDNNYNVVRSVSTVNMNGTDREITTNYSDYRKTPEGYSFDYKCSTVNGEINLNTIEVNPKIDDAIFRPGN